MKKTKPFFAKFLENQLNNSTSKEVKGGDDCIPEISMTLKAPSDIEDGGPLTLKYPSDLEDPMTAKYPSDQEDH